MPFMFPKRRHAGHRSIRPATAVAALLAASGVALAGNFVEPPVFASSHGVLDLLIVVLPQPVPSISYVPPSGPVINPTGWVYQICPRASATGNQCPAGSPTTSYYGGIRLALQKGDELKFRFVNQLPSIDPVMLANMSDPGGANLPLNPTNIHTHGLVVQARAPTLSDPTFGDYIFVDIYNPANGIPVPQGTHQHGSIVMGFADYRIDIPANHPSGAFWFHPHVHGLAVNQVSSGMAGIISIGKVGDYASGDLHKAPFPEANVRHLVRKEMQVLAAGTYVLGSGSASVADGTVLNQEDPTFCTQFPDGPAEIRQGSCPGADNTADMGNNYTGGTWFLTVSGQQFPTITMTEPDGEIWRLTNASANVTYDLQLNSDATQAPMIMQLISVDGVSIDVPPPTSLETEVQLGGARFKVVACPPAPPSGLTSVPVCVSQFVMMPSSRAELWVTYRDANGNVVTPPAGATGTFRTIGITTGPAGDAWPAVDLAKVAFDQTGPRRLAAFVLDVYGDALRANLPTGIFTSRVPYAKAASPPPNCTALAAGHHRRIFYGLVDPTNPASQFGLGYEEVDQNGVVVPGTQLPVTAFDPSQNTVCLPLGPGQTPVHETWELVNLATENHNFHIHQTKFRFVQAGAPPASPFASPINQKVGAGIMEDNVPLPLATPIDPTYIANTQQGYCTIAQWHTGVCLSTPQVVDIPFSQLGQFVYHCHILDHEDGGMMAKIQVVPAAR
jgi:L-ascorbate oxidase